MTDKEMIEALNELQKRQLKEKEIMKKQYKGIE